MKSKSGFTLLELIIAVAIIGILAGLAMPNGVKWARDNRLKKAATNLVSDMQLTKMNAIRTNRNWAIVFKPSSGSYFICSKLPASPDDEWAKCASGDIEKNVNFSDYESKVEFGHGNATYDATIAKNAFPSGFDHVGFGKDGTKSENVLEFTPNGTMTPPSNYAYISNSENTCYAIGALSSGVIRLKKWSNSGW